MTVAIVTGSAGLVGAEAARFFSDKGLDVVGIDNDMRSYFFGAEASTRWSRERLERDLPRYTHVDCDIRDEDAIKAVFQKYEGNIEFVLHTAAQPSHDWAAREPLTDFSVNATGTLNLLERHRHFAQQAPFLFVSTNKVYGDTPNHLPLVELDQRWELSETHPYSKNGIDESMSIDQTLHSLFGASKAAADLLVQEYGRYFDIPTACFRGGCLTGPGHSGTELHGFLAYLVKCAITGRHYTVFGYGGKQVRDNIHSYDLVNAFWHFFQKPRIAEVYNIGGARHSNCSMREAIAICERLTGRPMSSSYNEENRVGDHMWWISDVSKFRAHYPEWDFTYDIDRIIEEIHAGLVEREG